MITLYQNNITKLLIVLAVMLSLPAGWAHSKDIKETVVAKVGDENITYEDVENAYMKNLNRSAKRLYELPKDSLNSFLDLYINYRLKVHDAIAKNVMAEPEIKNEIEENRAILADKFYFDKMLVEPEVAKLVEMRKKEFKVAIIMISLPEPNSNDTAAAREKIDKVLDRLNKGESFGTVARDMSEDVSTSKAGGVIDNYITAGKVQRQIEHAIYTLKEAEYNKEPIKTAYGYFIVKVLDKGDRYYIKPAHILIGTQGESKLDSLKSLADSLYQAIQNGADFEELARKYSQDQSSAENGGSLGRFYSRSTGFEDDEQNVVAEFHDVLFKLKKGEVAAPVKSRYGYHIVKNLDEKRLNEEDEIQLVTKMYKRLYYDSDRTKYMDSMLKANNFKVEMDIIHDIASQIDTTKFLSSPNWDEKLNDGLRKTIIMSVAGGKVTVEEFIKLARVEASKKNMRATTTGIKNMSEELAKNIVFRKVTAGMEQKYPEFEDMVKEFRDGILMYHVVAEEVWNKLEFDSTLAREYYESRKDNYRTEMMYDISEIYLLNDSLTSLIQQKLKAGEDFEELAANYTMRDAFRYKKGSWGPLSPTKNQLAALVAEKTPKEGEILDPIKYQLGYSIVRVNKVMPPRVKTFEEAIPDLAPSFQDMMQQRLTDKWIASLKDKFNVKIYQDKLNSVVKELNKNKN